VDSKAPTEAEGQQRRESLLHKPEVPKPEEPQEKDTDEIPKQEEAQQADTEGMSAVSLKERLKQYQNLKDTAPVTAAFVPTTRQQELDFVSKKSPFRSSFRKLQHSESDGIPGFPTLDDATVDTAEATTVATKGKHKGLLGES
jgi:hypothetical protein